MTVDQTRRNDFSGSIDPLSRGVSTFDLRAWTNGNNAAIGNSNAAILDDAARLVHGHDRAAEHEQIDWLPASLGSDI